MLFHEIYGTYYQVTAEVLKEASAGALTRENMMKLIREKAFEESGLSIPDGLTGERWRLLHRDLTSSLEKPPSTPVTTLEKRWLKALLLDPRIQLFSPDTSGLENVEPLFTPEMIVYYDRYMDGDPFTDPEYIQHFQCILKALKEGTNLHVRCRVRRGIEYDLLLTPNHLEYSEKDDQFRLIAAGTEKDWILNVSGITECAIDHTDSVRAPQEQKKRAVTFELMNHRNALDRVLLHFSHLEKVTRRLNENCYQVTLYYDPNDETEMLIRILSFGRVIHVVEPKRFIRKMEKRISSQLQLIAAFHSDKEENTAMYGEEGELHD